MLIFYTPETPTIILNNEVQSCDKFCVSNCLKPKSKCCNKYKKKGINCKRCPNILLKTAS